MLDKNKKIEERAIDLDEHPEIYLSQRKAVSQKEKLYKTKFNEIVDMIKNMRWQDIRWETSGNQETVILPQPIRTAIVEAHSLNYASAERDFRQSSFGFKDTFRSSSYIYMKVDNSQRSHFPNSGIPNALRGSGLGYKMYRALLQKYKWLQSDTAGTIEKDYAWASIISPKKNAQGELTEDDVHSIAGPNFVFAMIKDLPVAQKIDIAKRFISNIPNKDSLTKRNFAIDKELLDILPEDVKAQVDVESQAASLEVKRRARYAKYAPFGIDAHNWELGDYIVLKQYLMDINYNIPVRKVVLNEGGRWTALKMEDIPAFERDGTINDPRHTSEKRDWVKSQLQRGQVDPSAGRIPRRGGSGTPGAPAQTTAPTRTATDDGLSRAQRTAIANFLRQDYSVWAKGQAWEARNTGSRGNRNQPIPAFLVITDGTGRSRRYNVINARTGEAFQNLTVVQFEQLELKKMDTVQLQSKANVSANDWVFVKEHKTLAGYLMMVAYITPASNTRPGVYVKMPAGQRDIHITRPQSLYKVTPAATNEWVVGFDNFDMV